MTTPLSALRPLLLALVLIGQQATAQIPATEYVARRDSLAAPSRTASLLDSGVARQSRTSDRSTNFPRFTI